MVIGVTGFKTSGKDTVADYLVDRYGFQKYSFAKPLKDGVMAFFGWDWERMNDPELKEEVDPFWGISPRQVLQFMGTNAIRDAMPEAYPVFKEITGNNFWVKRFLQTYQQNSLLDFVVPDCRYENEILAIKECHGTIIRVNRNASVPKVIEHISEDINSLKGINYDLDNNADRHSLHKQIDDIMEGYFGYIKK